MKKIKTPCIGICSTVFGDEVCRGCKRFVHEVIDWNAYEDEQKSLVLERLKHFTEQVLSGKIKVIDQQRFFQSLKVVGVSTRQSLATAVLDFLRKSSRQIDDLSEHGLAPMPEYRVFSAEELKLMIEEEILILSQATYNRSFNRKFTILAGPADDDPGAQQTENASGHTVAYSTNHSSEVTVS